MGAAVGCVGDAVDEARDALAVLQNAGAGEWERFAAAELALLSAVRCGRLTGVGTAASAK